VDRKLTLKVTAGNLRHSHLYIRGHHDFFPADAIGPPRRNCDRSHEFELILDGLGRTIQTDIPRDAKTGKPRNFLRDRQSIGKFYRHHKLKVGESARGSRQFADGLRSRLLGTS